MYWFLLNKRKYKFNSKAKFPKDILDLRPSLVNMLISLKEALLTKILLGNPDNSCICKYHVWVQKKWFWKNNPIYSGYTSWWLYDQTGESASSCTILWSAPSSTGPASTVETPSAVAPLSAVEPAQTLGPTASSPAGRDTPSLLASVPW